LRIACRREGFVPKLVKEAHGASSALAFVTAGFGLAVVSEPFEREGADGVVFRELSAKKPLQMPVGAVWKPGGVATGVVSRFVDTLVQACASEKAAA
jgi:DNA-binding transcriptional LysR family regulator